MAVPEDSLRRLLRARDTIHARYAQALRIDDLAREAALSPFHFLRLFRSAFGETPHRYLTHDGRPEGLRGAFEERRALPWAPQERPYGLETVLRDDSGNWFSFTQQRMQQAG